MVVDHINKHTEEKDEYRKARDFKNKNKFLDFMEE